MFSWNIFDGGHLIAAYDEAKANLGAAAARVKAAELTLIQNLEQAEIAVEAAQERIQAARVLIASPRSAPRRGRRVVACCSALLCASA